MSSTVRMLLVRGMALGLAVMLLVGMTRVAFAAGEPDGDEEAGEASSLEEAEEEEEAQEVVSSGTVTDYINNMELYPTAPKSAVLDQLLDEIMDEIVDEDMDPYDQLVTCYDYFVDTMSYGSHMRYLNTPVSDSVTCRSIYSSYGEVEGFGAVALTARVGMCNAYSAGFILMARKLGFNAYLVRGSTRSAGGGYAYHEWTEIKVGDTTYLFDPQLEQDLVRAGLPEYSVFCKTYDQVPGRYIKY